MSATVPKRTSRSFAVFSPMPGTPGMLSELSPMSALRSIMRMGSKPYSSRKRSGVYSIVSVCPMRVLTLKTWVLSVMSCRLSLSPVTTSHVQPAASQRRATVPSRSSASQPASSSRRTPI